MSKNDIYKTNATAFDSFTGSLLLAVASPLASTLSFSTMFSDLLLSFSNLAASLFNFVSFLLSRYPPFPQNFLAPFCQHEDCKCSHNHKFKCLNAVKFPRAALLTSVLAFAVVKGEELIIVARLYLIVCSSYICHQRTSNVC